MKLTPNWLSHSYYSLLKTTLREQIVPLNAIIFSLLPDLIPQGSHLAFDVLALILVAL